MDDQWFVMIENDPKGPFSTAQIKQWVREGRIKPDQFVRRGNDGAWVLAKRLRFAKSLDLSTALIAATAAVIAGEAVLLVSTHPEAGRWALWVLGGYVVLCLRVFGFFSFAGRKKPA
jgi:hypothetical protein